MQQFTWIYSLTSALSPSQEEALIPALSAITHNWKSHGTPISGTVHLAYSRFVILQAAPENGRPSGCSIDGLKHSVQELLNSLQLSWADASEIFFRAADGNIAHTRFNLIPSLVASGALTPDTPVFDHSLGQSDDLSRWEQPLKSTWLKRYLPVETSQQA